MPHTTISKQIWEQINEVNQYRVGVSFSEILQGILPSDSDQLSAVQTVVNEMFPDDTLSVSFTVFDATAGDFSVQEQDYIDASVRAYAEKYDLEEK